MENSGGGATFVDLDVQMAKRILGLINMSKYNLDSSQIVQAAEALSWMKHILLPGMEANVLEVLKTTQAKGE